MSEAVVFAPAKINLALHVTGRRADGYHLLDMLVAFAGVGDTLRARPAGSDLFTVDGPFGDAIPRGPDNLVLRARDALRASLGGAAVALHLTKRLPPASGIGGGSADAAATLVALTRLWQLDPAPAAAIAPLLGADVPMCLAGRASRAAGIGDILSPLASFPSAPAVLVNPGVSVATPAVFSALAGKDNPALPPVPPLTDVHAVAAYMRATRNDLEAPALALAPAIGTALSALEATAPLATRMSGSGATCFALYGDGAAATAAAAAIAATHPDWFVEATTIG